MKQIIMTGDVHSPDVPQLPVGANPIVKIQVVMMAGDIIDNKPLAGQPSNLKQDIAEATANVATLANITQKRKSGRPKGAKNKPKKVTQ